MNFGDIIIYLFIGLIIYFIVKKVLLAKSVTSYSPEETRAKIKDRNAILLDVRTPEERKRDHIKGSFHIPLYDLRKRSEELKKFKDKEIICYCRSGNRSMSAAGILKKDGFNAANMRGGINKW